jgi:hypothetical protein
MYEPSPAFYDGRESDVQLADFSSESFLEAIQLASSANLPQIVYLAFPGVKADG